MESNTANPDLPLSEAAFFILFSMVKEPRHGYAILKDVQVLSQGRITLSTGTLYGAIKRMLEHGWIEPASGLPTAVHGRARKSYRLTALGSRIVKAELARLQAIIQAVRLRVAGEL